MSEGVLEWLAGCGGIGVGDTDVFWGNIGESGKIGSVGDAGSVGEVVGEHENVGGNVKVIILSL